MTRHRNSVLSLHKLLQEVCLAPDQFLQDSALFAALQSQGALAAFSGSGLEISGSSLNTVKRACEASIPGGFGELDNLRKKAKALIEVQQARKKRAYGTRTNLEDKIASLQRDIQLLRQDLLICTRVISLSISQGRRYADVAGPDVKARCKREQRELLAYLATRSLSADIPVSD